MRNNYVSNELPILVLLISILVMFSSCEGENDPYSDVWLRMEMPGTEYSSGETVLVDLLLVNGSSERLEFVYRRDKPAATISVFAGDKLIWDHRTVLLRDSNWIFNGTKIHLEPISMTLIGRVGWKQVDFEGKKVGPGSYLLRGEFRTDVPGTDYTVESFVTILPAQ